MGARRNLDSVTRTWATRFANLSVLIIRIPKSVSSNLNDQAYQMSSNTTFVIGKICIPLALSRNCLPILIFLDLHL